MYEAIVLVGGLGTRLREVIPDLPKAMAPLAGRPFLAWQLDYLINQRVSRFVLSTGYKAEIIENYFGTSYRGAKIFYAREKTPLGTGGAIIYSLQFTTQERVFVLNGDSLCEVNLASLRELTLRNPNSLGLVIKHLENVSRYGAIRFDVRTKKLTQFLEKSTSGSGYINVGIYDIPRSLIETLNCDSPFSFEEEVLQKCVNQNLFALVANGFFIDIGIPEDLLTAQGAVLEWLGKGG